MTSNGYRSVAWLEGVYQRHKKKTGLWRCKTSPTPIPLCVFWSLVSSLNNSITNCTQERREWGKTLNSGKLHSKIVISDLVSFFVEFNGESLRSKLEQEHGQTGDQKWPNCLGWQIHNQYYITGGRRHKFGSAEWSRPVTYAVISADHEHFESLTWPCMIGGTTDVANPRTCHFCPVSLTLSFEIWPQTFIIGFYGKKNLSDQS